MGHMYLVCNSNIGLNNVAYYKSIKTSGSSPYPHAKVFEKETGRLCASEIIHVGLLFNSRNMERSFKAAHKWADNVIRILEEQEV